MDNICPYCNHELVKGFVDGGKFFFRWHDEKIGFFEKNTIFGGEVLSEKNLIKSYRCKNCNKIIINLDELDK